MSELIGPKCVAGGMPYRQDYDGIFAYGVENAMIPLSPI
jgi:hypothetical protein